MKYLLTVAILLFSTDLYAKELTLTEVMKATCRITSFKLNQLGQTIGSTRGTGTVIREDDSYYYVLTNGHVASKMGSIVDLEFFNDGYKSGKLSAVVYWRYYTKGTTKDAAIIKLDKSKMQEYVPIIIPLAPKDHVIPRGTKIYGAGHPEGMWLSAWIARVASLDERRLYFDMTPQGGQSGTAILSKVTIEGEDYTRVSGMLTWRFSRGTTHSYGGAIRLHRLYELFAGNVGPEEQMGSDAIEIACEYCNYDKKDHYVIKFDDGSVSKEYYCPKDIEQLRSKIYALYGNRATLVRVEFPIFPERPRIEDIDPDNERPGPLFPNLPPPTVPPVDKEKEGLRDKIGVLERLRDALLQKGKDIDSKLKKAVDDKLKTDRELGQSKLDLIIVDRLLGEEHDKNQELEKENESFVDRVIRLEDKHNALLVRLEKIAKDKAAWLNHITISYFNVGLGNFLVWVFGMLASGTIMTTVWSKWTFPFLVSRFGFLPAKILEAVIKRKFPGAIMTHKKPRKPFFKTLAKGDTFLYNKVEVDINNDEDLHKTVEPPE